MMPDPTSSEALEQKQSSYLKDFVVWLAPLSTVRRFVKERDPADSSCTSRLFSEGCLHHVEKSSTDNACFTVTPDMKTGAPGEELVMLAIAEIRIGTWAAGVQG
jgi:hypothetical protein